MTVAVSTTSSNETKGDPVNVPAVTTGIGIGAGPGSTTCEVGTIRARVRATRPAPSSASLTSHGSGRAWLVLVPDLDDATGQNTAQLPDLDASPNPGLSLGDWTTVAESRVFLSTDGSTNDDLVLTERFRQEVTYSRSAAATLTVN